MTSQNDWWNWWRQFSDWLQTHQPPSTPPPIDPPRMLLIPFTLPATL